MVHLAFRSDREGFSFHEGFSSNKRKILRDLMIMVGVTAPAGLSWHTRQVTTLRPAPPSLSRLLAAGLNHDG
jgi:hypothetical protein